MSNSPVAARMASFNLGQREHGELFPVDDWRSFRKKMAFAIEEIGKL